MQVILNNTLSNDTLINYVMQVLISQLNKTNATVLAFPVQYKCELNTDRALQSGIIINYFLIYCLLSGNILPSRVFF